MKDKVKWFHAIWRDRNGAHPAENVELTAYRAHSGNVMIEIEHNGLVAAHYLSLAPVWAKAFAEEILKAVGDD